MRKLSAANFKRAEEGPPIHLSGVYTDDPAQNDICYWEFDAPVTLKHPGSAGTDLMLGPSEPDLLEQFSPTVIKATYFGNGSLVGLYVEISLAPTTDLVEGARVVPSSTYVTAP